VPLGEIACAWASARMRSTSRRGGVLATLRNSRWMRQLWNRDQSSVIFNVFFDRFTVVGSSSWLPVSESAFLLWVLVLLGLVWVGVAVFLKLS
jgi:hypothetical protein